MGGLTRSDISFTLNPEEVKHDVMEMMSVADRYSSRPATVTSEEIRGGGADTHFDRGRQQLYLNGDALELGSEVSVYQQGEQVADVWVITGMNAVEVTLRDQDGTKLKVTLAQLRSGRYEIHRSG